MFKLVGCFQKVSLSSKELGVTYVVVTDERPLFSSNSTERICVVLKQQGTCGLVKCRVCTYDIPSLSGMVEYSKITLVDLPIEIKISVFDVLSREVL